MHGRRCRKPPPAAAEFPFSPQDAMEFMQKMWNPFGVADARVSAQCRRIPRPRPRRDAGHAVSESGGDVRGARSRRRSSARSTSCKIIENWLAMSLNMMQMSIKTMELQKASLEAMRAAHAPGSARSQSSKG